MSALDHSGKQLKRELDGRRSEAPEAAQFRITRELNQYVRRLRQYQAEADWIATVLEAASRFAREVAIFALSDGTCVLRGERNLNVPERLSFPLSSARAFTSAVDTKDPVIALRTPAEIGEALSASRIGARAHVIPIANGTRIVAILFAAGEETVDIDGIELIAGIASAVLERRSNATLHAQIDAFPSRDKPEAPERPASVR